MTSHDHSLTAPMSTESADASETKLAWRTPTCFALNARETHDGTIASTYEGNGATGLLGDLYYPTTGS